MACGQKRGARVAASETGCWNERMLAVADTYRKKRLGVPFLNSVYAHEADERVHVHALQRTEQATCLQTTGG